MGSRVTVREVGEEDEETYEIVGSQEANPILGRISDESPLGRSLMGKKKGDRIEFEAPRRRYLLRDPQLRKLNVNYRYRRLLWQRKQGPSAGALSQ